MILQLPPNIPEVSPVAPPHYLTTTGIAGRAGLHRATVQRQLALGLLIADAFVTLGTVAQPIFLETRAVDVLKNAQLPRSARGGEESR